MKNNEIIKLLNKLATIPPESWVWKAGWETVINDTTISIIGSSEFGYSYYIEIDGVEAYHGGNYDILFLFKSPIDKQLDRICNILYKYSKEEKKNKIVDKIKRIIN